MAQFVSLGKNDPRDVKRSLLEKLWEAFSSLDKFTKLFIITGLLLVAVTPFINSILLTTRNYAQDQGVIKRVEISPLSIDTKVGASDVNLSAVAFGRDGQPLTSGVYYEWGTTVTDAVGKLSRINNDTAFFTPLSPGYGELHVIAIGGDKFPVLKSIKITVRDASGNLPAVQPTP